MILVVNLRENGHTLRLAFPIIVGLVGQMLMGITDTVMVGRVGVIPLAACAFANTVISVPLVFGFGLLAAVSVNASHAYGAGRLHAAGETLRGGIFIAAVMGLLIALASHGLLPFLSIFGQPAGVNEAVGTYFLLCAWSLIPVFVTGATKNFCEALARPWPPFWIMIGGVLLNVFLNWVFIFGNLGVRPMGLNGAGLATLLSRAATMGCLLVYPAIASSLRHAWPKNWMAPGLLSEARNLFGIGINTAGLHLCEVSGFSLGSLMMGWLGVVPLAAHQIALSCAATTFMVPLGLAQAVSVRVGHARGSQRVKEIPVIIKGALTMTVGVMAVFAATYLLAGSVIAGWFTLDNEVKILTSQLLVLAGVFQIFDGIQIVSSGALRGFADTRIPFLIGFVSYWLVALPFSYVTAFSIGIGPQGIWMGFVMGLGVAAAAMGARLWKKCASLNFSPETGTAP